jgi:uncharacterized protein with PIN domain
MTLIVCGECGRYFNKYGSMIAGSSDGDKLSILKCPHCGKIYWQTPEAKRLTRILNGEEDENEREY